MPVLPIDAPSPIASVEAGTSYSTQCVKVPEGASGSSQMTAMLFDWVGTPLNSSGGGTSCPSQVYFLGIGAPSANTDELTLSAITSLRSGRASIEDEGDLQVDLVTDDLSVLHFCLLFLHPSALDVAERLAGASDTLHDGVLETLGRGRTN